MQTKKTKASILLTGLLAGILATGQLHAEAFTMVCKSGGKMKLEVDEISNKKKLRFDLYFKRAARGANKTEPRQGQCAWTHRALNLKESTHVTFTIKGTLKGTITAKREEVGFKAINTPTSTRIREYIKKPNTVFSMVVSYSGPGKVMNVTKLHKAY